MSYYKLYCQLTSRNYKLKHIGEHVGMGYLKWFQRARIAYGLERPTEPFGKWVKKHGVRFLE